MTMGRGLGAGGGLEPPADAIVCPRCGWRNETSARMCGGCGQPLPLPLALAPTPPSDVAYGDTVTLPGATRYASPADDTPTVFASDRTVLAPPPDVPRHPAYRAGAAPAPAWPASATRPAYAPSARAVARQAPSRRGNCLAQALVTLLVFALVLGCLGIGLWAVVIRPPLHAKVDGGIRSAVGAVVAAANTAMDGLKAGEGGSAQIPASQVNSQLPQNQPANQPLRNVSLDFAANGVVVKYTLAGHTGELYAGLAARGGRLVATGANVTGPLALVESSSELLQAVRDELAGLTTSVAVTSVTTANHTLTVTVQASGGG